MQTPAEAKSGATPLDAASQASHFLNRELSWLDWNRRVLALAEDPTQKLLERLKYLEIVGSNLDEFFQVRVAGLRAQVDAGITAPASDGRTPREQLALIRMQVLDQLRMQESILHKELWRLLGANPTPMVWPIYTELQQGTIDAQENPLSVILNWLRCWA